MKHQDLDAEWYDRYVTKHGKPITRADESRLRNAYRQHLHRQRHKEAMRRLRNGKDESPPADDIKAELVPLLETLMNIGQASVAEYNRNQVRYLASKALKILCGDAPEPEAAKRDVTRATFDDLSPRTRKALRNAGITDLRKLRATRMAAISKLPGIGKAALGEITSLRNSKEAPHGPA